MALGGNVFELDFGVKTHVLGVDEQDLEAAFFIRHAELDFAVKATKTAQRGVELVGAICGADDDDLAASLDAVHEREEHRDDAPLELAVGLVARRRDRVDFVDEDDGRAVLLRLLRTKTETKGCAYRAFRIRTNELKRGCGCRGVKKKRERMTDGRQTNGGTKKKDPVETKKRARVALFIIPLRRRGGGLPRSHRPSWT